MNARPRIAARLATALVVLVTGVLALANPAAATGNGDWSVEPGGREGPGARSSFNYTLAPDQVFRDSVTVANVSDVEIELDLYPTDALNTPLDSSFALLPQDEDPVGLGTWIELAVDNITLQPGTQAEIPFLVRVPRDASPGDHAAGIVAQNVATESEIDAQGVGIEIRRRVAARVYLRVDGPLAPELVVSRVIVDTDIEPFAPFVGDNRGIVTFEIRNVGNTRITPSARLRLEGLLGRSVYDSGFQELKELLPGSSVILQRPLRGLPAAELVSANVDVRATDPVNGDELNTTGSKSYWSVSWISLLLLVVLIGLVALVVRRIRRTPSPHTPDVPPPAAPRERELVDA